MKILSHLGLFLVLAIQILDSTAWTSVENTSPRNYIAKEPVIEMPNVFAKRIVIQGHFGELKITSSADRTLKVVAQKVTPHEVGELVARSWFRQTVIRTQTVGESIVVRAQIHGSKDDWAKWVGGESPRPGVRLEVQAPKDLALEIYWVDGDVQVDKWMGSLTFTGQAGLFRASEVQGQVVARLNRGQADFEKIRGSLSIENQSSHIRVGEVVGALQVRSHAGSLEVGKVQGQSHISSIRGAVKIENSVGAAEVSTHLGKVAFLGHQGNLFVQSENGEVSAQLQGGVKAQVISMGGRVDLKVPANSGAQVDLLTEKGKLDIPSQVRQKKTGYAKKATGKLAGTVPGLIKVNTRNADISLKAL